MAAVRGQCTSGTKPVFVLQRRSTSWLHSFLVFCIFEINKYKEYVNFHERDKATFANTFFEILETSLENLETIHFPILVSIKSYASIVNDLHELINTRCRSWPRSKCPYVWIVIEYRMIYVVQRVCRWVSIQIAEHIKKIINIYMISIKNASSNYYAKHCVLTLKLRIYKGK